MKTASTNTPASKRLSLHSLPPRQSLPTWLLFDHAFSIFYLKSSSICWVCPTSPSLKVGDVDVSVSTPSHRLAPAARSEAHTTRDTGWLWRILALFFILLFIISVYSASLELHFFSSSSLCCALPQSFWDSFRMIPEIRRYTVVLVLRHDDNVFEMQLDWH